MTMCVAVFFAEGSYGYTGAFLAGVFVCILGRLGFLTASLVAPVLLACAGNLGCWSSPSWRASGAQVVVKPSAQSLATPFTTTRHCQHAAAASKRRRSSLDNTTVGARRRSGLRRTPSASELGSGTPSKCGSLCSSVHSSVSSLAAISACSSCRSVRQAQPSGSDKLRSASAARLTSQRRYISPLPAARRESPVRPGPRASTGGAQQQHFHAPRGSLHGTSQPGQTQPAPPLQHRQTNSGGTAGKGHHHHHDEHHSRQQGQGGHPAPAAATAAAAPSSSTGAAANAAASQRPPGVLSHAETRALLSKSFGWHCSRGGKQRNDDRATAFRAQEGTPGASRVALVCDGHGGPDTATAVLDAIQQALTTACDFSACWSLATTQAALQQRLDLLEEELCPLMAEHQGTTMTVLVAPDRGRRGLVWWTGDSPAMLVTEDAQGNARGQLLIKPHNQHHEDERRRLAAHGVTVGANGSFAASADGEELIGVCRMFGNLSTKRAAPGLCARADMACFEIPENAIALVVVSDGVSDKLDPTALAQSVRQSLRCGRALNDAEASAAQLCKQAVDLQTTDNCSAVVLPLKYYTAPAMGAMEKLAARRAAAAATAAAAAAAHAT